jgi:hypothetical protein
MTGFSQISLSLILATASILTQPATGEPTLIGANSQKVQEGKLEGTGVTEAIDRSSVAPLIRVHRDDKSAAAQTTRFARQPGSRARHLIVCGNHS